ncbi:MAG TPA: methyltransferase [Candidatus Limnocylindrales bacterium]
MSDSRKVEDEVDAAASRSAAARLHELLASTRLWHAVTAAANLGLPDALRGGARSPADVADELGLDETALARLLGVLAAAGVLAEREDGRFELAEVGQLLRADAPASLRDWVRYMGRPYVQEAWANLDHSIRTGENTFAWLHGESVWQWRTHEPAERELFDAAMAVQTSAAHGVVEAFDFGRLGTLVDVGGGSGVLLASILAAHPLLRGTLFDQPSVVAADATRRTLAAAGVADRCQVVGGSFFEAVPARAGGYLLKSILHDWDEVDARRILGTVRRDARPDSLVLIVERIVGGANSDLEGKLSDLNMLVMPGGRERSEVEWRSLLAASGFRLGEVRPLPRPFNLLVAELD